MFTQFKKDISKNWRRSFSGLGAAVVFAGVLAVATGAQATTVYEWNEGGAGSGTNSPYVSHHGATGPILADDFVAATGGLVSSLTWWGSGPLSASNSDLWEITFHANDPTNTPAFTAPGGGLSQHFATVSGFDSDGDGVYQYTTSWSPMDLTLTAGAQYWLSIANGSNGWNWANAGLGGPQVGSQSFFAQQSVGGLPSVIAGPHDGPWTQVMGPTGLPSPTNLAFKISVVPLPASLPMLALGLAGLFGFARRRRANRRVF